ncbi:MAG: hypothetical protein ACOX6P_00200 [Candidatus Merdivicinus sp.]|jgi:membrane protein YdbS with pleckstrin-like domain
MEGKISKKALVIWEILGALAAILLAYVICLLIPERSFWWYFLLWLDGLAFVLCEFLYLPLRYENEVYITNEEYIEYQRGLIIFAKTRILRRAVLYVTVVRSPLSLLLGTRSLLVCSMGTRMLIPFLPIREAEELLRDITPRVPAIQPRMFHRKEQHDE